MEQARKLPNGVLYLELDGSKGHYEMGVQHGRALRDQIRACVAQEKRWLGDAGEGQVDAVLRELYGACFLSDTQKYLPHLYDELRGIADGSGCPMEDVLLINCPDEAQEISDRMSERKKRSADDGKCTCIGLARSESQPCRLAQNLDEPGIFDGFQALFRIQLPGRNILLYGFCGQLQGMGINDRGISVIANAVVNGSISLEHGVPNTIMARAFYECESVEQCEALLKKCPCSTSTAYTIADFDHVRCFETTARDVAEVPMEGPGIAHTNHLLASTDYRTHAGACEGSRILRMPEGVSWAMTEERLEIARDFVAREGQAATPEALMGFLDTPPVFRNYGSPTLESCVSVSDREDPHIYIAAAKGTGRTYLRFSIRREADPA